MGPISNSILASLHQSIDEKSFTINTGIKRCILAIVRVQRCGNHQGASDCRACTSLGEYPAENQYIQFYGISERQVCVADI